MLIRSAMRVGLGIAVLLLSFPLISLSSDFAEVSWYFDKLLLFCYASNRATLLPKSSKQVSFGQNN